MPFFDLPRPAARSALVDLWAQGMRRDSSPDKGWRQVLFARLTSRHSTLPTGPMTAVAEDGLGLGRHCYFYVGRCEPEIGNQAVVFRRPKMQEARVTPFDTGGIWHRHIVTDPPSPQAHLGDLVARHSFDCDRYRQPMRDWVGKAFNSELDYTSGIAPTHPFAPEIKVDASSGARHWTWEARVPLSDADGAVLRPLVAVLDDDQYRDFTAWVRRSTQYSRETRQTVLRVIRAIRIDPGGEAHGVFLNRLLGGR
jgi:hypothetical protein